MTVIADCGIWHNGMFHPTGEAFEATLEEFEAMRLRGVNVRKLAGDVKESRESGAEKPGADGKEAAARPEVSGKGAVDGPETAEKPEVSGEEAAEKPEVSGEEAPEKPKATRKRKSEGN